MSGYTLRITWPIEDEALFDDEAIRAARRAANTELPALAERHQVTIVGQPEFQVNSRTVVCTAPAIPRPRVDPLLAQYRDRRHATGVRPYVLAELAGLSPQIVYTSEAGRRDPRLSTLRAWADALGCDLRLVPRHQNLTPARLRATTTERNAA